MNLLTCADAAAFLGLTPEGVRKLADRGLLPCQRTVGGVRLFLYEDVEALRQRSEQRPTRWHPYPKEAAS